MSLDHARRTSPCLNICTLTPEARHCIGCGRTPAEVAGWVRFTDAEREAIVKELPRRLAALGGSASGADAGG